jgi:hypothetical protein
VLACLDVHLIKDMNAWLPQTSCPSGHAPDIILCPPPLLLSRPYIVGLVLTLPEIHDLLSLHLRWCVPGLPTKCGFLVFLLSLVPEKDDGGNRGLVRTQTHSLAHTHSSKTNTYRFLAQISNIKIKLMPPGPSRRHCRRPAPGRDRLSPPVRDIPPPTFV